MFYSRYIYVIQLSVLLDMCELILLQIEYVVMNMLVSSVYGMFLLENCKLCCSVSDMMLNDMSVMFVKLNGVGCLCSIVSVRIDMSSGEILCVIGQICLNLLLWYVCVSVKQYVILSMVDVMMYGYVVGVGVGSSMVLVMLNVRYGSDIVLSWIS